MVTGQNCKAHVSFGMAAATKLGFGLFSLIALATNVVVPQHQTEKNATFTQQVMNRCHEVNEMYSGTLSEVHHLLYATGISSNDSFKFRNAMKQDDKLAFVDAMGKEMMNLVEGTAVHLIYFMEPVHYLLGKGCVLFSLVLRHNYVGC